MDDVPRLSRFHGICEAIFRQSDESLPQRPTAAPCPSGRIHRPSRAERFSARTRKERPCNNGITGRVTHPGTAKINHDAQLAIIHKQVAHSYIAVKPNGCARPWCREGGFQPIRHSFNFNFIFQSRYGLPGFSRIKLQWAATKGAVQAGRRATHCLNLLKGGEEVRQRDCKFS